jgi:hypothetical protein
MDELYRRVLKRVERLSDDALRSEYVSAGHPWAETDPVSVVTRQTIRLVARARGVQLRDRDETVRVLLADMGGF